MTQFYSHEDGQFEKFTLPDAETFYMDDSLADEFGPQEDGDLLPLGWYFRFCIPGCLPDSDPFGPYLEEEDAIQACRDMA